MSAHSVRPRIASVISVVVLLVAASPAATAAEPGTITGSVTSAGGDQATDTRVTLVELRLSVFVDAEGRYRFDDVPPGEYHLQAVSRQFGSSVREVDFRGGLATVDMSLDVSPHRERIIVSAAHDRGSDEVAQPVGVMDRTELSEALAPTLGETLDGQAGVSSSYFGPGSSRPVIRGQGGGRISVLEGGLGTGDASTTSPDHAVASDPIAAERIEILRGPATLLYGSTAVGGVVNIIDQRVPDYVPRDGLAGHVDLRYGGAADEAAGSMAFDGGAGRFAWHADGLLRDTDDYDIPGYAVRGDPTSAYGRLPNSSLESEGGTLGASWVGERGFVGGSLRTFDTNYGIPAAIEGDAAARGAAAGDGLRIDLEQVRGDVRGAFRRDGAFHEIRFAVGATDYEHRELEGGVVGTRFLTDTLDARVEARHERGRWGGVLGAQLGSRSLEAIGDEAFVPASDTDGAALFALQDLHAGDLRWEFGARLERQRVDTPDLATPAPGVCGDRRARDFTGTSGSAGLAWLPGRVVALSASLAYTERLPSAEELYSCGAHAATQSFEIGDPELGDERSLGVDVGLRAREGRVTGELTLFANRYDDYVLALPTGAEVDGLPVFAFGQTDTEFVGAELTAVVKIVHAGEQHLDLEVQGDWVRATERASGDDLPYITPARWGASLRWDGEAWYAAAQVRRVGSASRAIVSAFDVADRTDAYTTVDARVGYRFASRGLVHDVMVRGSNLGDEEARNHTSRLRDLVPLPGRGVEAVYRLTF